MYMVFVHCNLKLPNFLMGSVLISWGYFFFSKSLSYASVIKE